MKKGGLKTIVSELQGASKMHLRQSKELEGHIDDIKSPASRNGYNQVNVQDLQDMGAVKKDKKGKQYVVNERLTGTSKDTLNVGNHYSGRKYKTGELIDETDYEDMSEKANKSPMSRDKFGGTPDNTDAQAAYEKATNQLYDEGTITETDDKAVKLIKKRVKKNAKKLTKSPLNFKGANSSNSSCWKGYKKVGTKKSPSGTGETVNDCKKI